ncbi:hypothetical protein AMAG_18206 [Allomyces macrogynus ATCC 38327]|uniref:Endonuclease/exonuclease/phosphatase domain-containing protein n=1 Tax=Allomyces macrogynus (strain ATCC 38327) TaxID=578462 RepID=A0A0L0SAP0_ALLM3|nr:hypothetical protein AMAG_18206 [Allomyces macrogynus ATCC 38327]|eukprot:KNE59556.1 hypothetical protein AMAG_18206 [Allomyces macrogynus ATCC 38327]
MNLLKVATAHVLGQVSSLLPRSGVTDGLPPGAVRSGSSWATNPLAAAFAVLGGGNDENALAPPYPAEWPCATSKKFHGFPCAHFNPAIGRWEYLYPGAPAPAPPSPVDGAPVLTVATYNIDFDTDVRFAERMRHIFLDVLPSTRADVICLQEVVLNTTVIDILRTAPWLQAGGGWYVSAIDRAAPVRGYDVLLLSRFPVAQLGWVPLPTFMGRRALVADVHVPGKRRFCPVAVRHFAGGAIPQAVEKAWTHPRENVPVCASDHVCVVVELALEGVDGVTDDGDETDRDLDGDVDLVGTPGLGTEAGTEPASPVRAQMLVPMVDQEPIRDGRTLPNLYAGAAKPHAP